MKKLITTCTIFLYAITLLNAQNNSHKNHWYFSWNAGIDFTSGTPVGVGTTAMYSNAASASMSDKDGELLFFTNGIYVYDKNGTQMPTSTGMLIGNSNSQYIHPAPQGAITLCDASNQDQYYVIATSGNNGQFDSLFYYKVDMTLNGGLGDVVSGSKTFVAANRGFQMTAVRRPNLKDWWIITGNTSTNNIEVFSLTSSGIATTPSYLGNGGQSNLMLSSSDYTHRFRSSSSGERLAITYDDGSSKFRSALFDFNKSTGIPSNAIDLSDYTNKTIAYCGLEFSPNSDVLYAGQMWYTGNFADHSGIMQ